MAEFPYDNEGLMTWLGSSDEKASYKQIIQESADLLSTHNIMNVDNVIDDDLYGSLVNYWVDHPEHTNICYDSSHSSIQNLTEKKRPFTLFDNTLKSDSSRITSSSWLHNNYSWTDFTVHKRNELLLSTQEIWGNTFELDTSRYPKRELDKRDLISTESLDDRYNNFDIKNQMSAPSDRISKCLGTDLCHIKQNLTSDTHDSLEIKSNIFTTQIDSNVEDVILDEVLINYDKSITIKNKNKLTFLEPLSAASMTKAVSAMNANIGCFIKNKIFQYLHQSSKNLGSKLVSALLSVKSNPWVANATGCALESALFVGERARYISSFASQVVTGDDPEIQYLNYVSNGLEGGDWKDILRLLSSHATLKFEQLDLVRDSNTIEPYHSQTQFKKQCFNDDKGLILDLINKANGENNNVPSFGFDIDDDMNSVDSDLSLDSAEEASYILTKMFVPPAFKESSSCKSCSLMFNLSRFRHHCRNCGQSFCNEHSQQRRRVLKLGITVPVRVCDSCAQVIDSIVVQDTLSWKHRRVMDYLSGKLRPYRPPLVDRKIDKLSRVLDYSIKIFKNSLFLSYPAMIAIETVDILKRYGISGLAGVMLREDFIEAVETLKSISGMDKKSCPISLHELTACIYYKLAINRGVRGCLPEEEHILHTQGQQDVLCENSDPINEDLNIAIRFSSLALKAVYADSVVECQRIGYLQGWDLLFAEFTAAPEQPAFAVFATGSNSNKRDYCSSLEGSSKRKEVVLCVRGTNSIHDVVTDIRATPVQFPPASDEFDVESKNIKDRRPSSKDAWVLLPSESNYACGGMVRAALWLLETVGPSIMELHRNNHDVIIIGHSLGGGVAALLTYLLMSSIPSVRCITYGCPNCMTADIADELKSRVLSVVLHDDIISRLSPASIRLLLKDIMDFRVKVFCNGTIYQHLQSDWNDIIERAGSLWSPRWRETYPNGIGTRTYASDSQDDNFVLVSQERMLESTESHLRGDEIADDDCEIVEEEKVLDIWLPGRIMHIYSHRGQYKAAIVDRNFATLRRIEVQGNIFTDHSTDAIMNGLLEVMAVRQASFVPPVYQSFDSSDDCCCCKNKFTWHSTFRSKPQEYREKHNCRNCGRLVCGPCSENRYPIPKYGLIYPGRVCDMCISRAAFVQ